MTRCFCRECGTKLKAMSYPDDDYRCPKTTCPYYDIEINSQYFKVVQGEIK